MPSCVNSSTLLDISLLARIARRKEKARSQSFVYSARGVIGPPEFLQRLCARFDTREAAIAATAVVVILLTVAEY